MGDLVTKSSKVIKGAHFAGLHPIRFVSSLRIHLEFLPSSYHFYRILHLLTADNTQFCTFVLEHFCVDFGGFVHLGLGFVSFAVEHVCITKKGFLELQGRRS